MKFKDDINIEDSTIFASPKTCYTLIKSHQLLKEMASILKDMLETQECAIDWRAEMKMTIEEILKEYEISQKGE